MARSTEITTALEQTDARDPRWASKVAGAVLTARVTALANKSWEQSPDASGATLSQPQPIEETN